MSSTVLQNYDVAVQFPMQMSLRLRARDCNRNGQLPLSTLTKYSMTYRRHSGIFNANFVPFLKAQHISHKTNPIQFAKRIRNTTISTFNCYMDYGNSSFWQIAHFHDTSNNFQFADNIALIVGASPKTRKPITVTNACKLLCNKSKKIYEKMYNMLHFNQLKSKLSTDIGSLNTQFKSNSNLKNEYLFKTAYQLRWSDEDENHHLNSSVSITMIEDCFSSWNVQLRNNKNSIRSITIIYWKEISVEKYKIVYPTIWNNDNGVFYGTIDVDNKHFIGFIVTFQKNIHELRSNL
eukprot:528646_1